MSTRMMKVRTVFFGVLLASATLVSGARAQATAVAQAIVPFAFHYGSSTLPAGKYSLAMTSDSILLLRGRGASAMGIVMHNPDRERTGTGKLVFRHTGERYTLQEVWAPGASEHLVCPKSKEPRRREVEEVSTASTEVEVALVESPR